MFAIWMLVAMQAGAAAEAMQPPRLRNADAVITFQDYPEAAARRSENGIVSVALDVSADGRVTSCEITEGTGSASLDERTCALFKARAKFDPAMDESHRAIPAQFRTAVAWGSDTHFLSTTIGFDLKVSRIPAGYQSPVRTKVIFDAAGHASSCKILQSSGSDAADQIACQQIRQRLAIPAPKSVLPTIAPAAVRSVEVRLLAQPPSS